MSGGLIFHNMPIVIDNWQKDDTYNIYTVGSRDKEAYFSPDKPKEGCIKPNWRYLFKLSRTTPKVKFPWQFWCEIIAYRFGCVIGVKVPPAHIGYSKKYEQGVDTYAALIEWFYDEKDEGYIVGGQLMESHIKNFDRLKGEKHNFKTIRGMFKDSDTGLEYWAKVLTFDILIGNTDRHRDNWGWIVKRTKKGDKMLIDINMSPAFDNGTALGYEILEEKLDKFDDAKLKSYLTHKKAKHHMKWSLDEKEQLNFYEFMEKFTMAFPQIKPIIAHRLSFTYQQVEEVLAPLVEAVSIPEYKLTRKRLDFMLTLIFERKRILEETLEL